MKKFVHLTESQLKQVTGGSNSGKVPKFTIQGPYRPKKPR